MEVFDIKRFLDSNITKSVFGETIRKQKFKRNYKKNTMNIMYFSLCFSHGGKSGQIA